MGSGLVSAAAKVQNADEISAIKGLGGLYQFDHVLTSTYENYAQMMNAGIATQADMEEAERIFTLLKQTKIQEYEHMLSLCERRDTRLFEKYHFKYYQLTGEAWNGHSLTSSCSMWEAESKPPGRDIFCPAGRLYFIKKKRRLRLWHHQESVWTQRPFAVLPRR